MDLVVLAAGLGNRYGGLKQIESIDKNHQFIIDYSVFDAIRAGFDRIIFVIKPENLKDFEDTIGKRIAKKVKVEYAFQEINRFVPNSVSLGGRTKPLGTAHAVLCAKDKIKGNFAVINADDFYGKGSFEEIFKFLKNSQNDDVGIVCYKAKNTLTPSGRVNRGVCQVKDGKITKIEESFLSMKNDKIVGCRVDEITSGIYTDDTRVSMNLLGFTPKILEFLEEDFKDFLQSHVDDLSKCEYYIPTAMTKFSQRGFGNLVALDTDEKWFGLTYKEDFEQVSAGIQKLVESGNYPQKLWE